MIRVSSGILVFSGAILLMAAALSPGAQADIFIRKNKPESTTESPAPSIYVPLKKARDKAFSLFKKPQKSITSGLDRGDLKGFDLNLLSSAGGEPKTAKDLMLIATAHNAVKNEAFRAMRAQYQAKINAQGSGYTQKSVSAAEQPVPTGTTPQGAAPTAPETQIYISPGAPKKGKSGVYTNY